MAQLCRHVLTSGLVCSQVAVNESQFCRHHQVVKTILALASKPVAYGAPPQLPFVFPEDRAAVQLNLMMVLKGLNDGRIDSRTANSMNRVLHTCMRNLQAGPLVDPEAKNVARSVIRTPEGEEIAPVREAPEESEQLEDGQLKESEDALAERGPLTEDDENLLADLFPEEIARYKAGYAARVQAALDAGLDPPVYEPWHLGKFQSKDAQHDAAQQDGEQHNRAQHDGAQHNGAGREGAERDQEDRDRIEHDRQAAHEEWMRQHANKSFSGNEQEGVRVGGLKAVGE